VLLELDGPVILRHSLLLDEGVEDLDLLPMLLQLEREFILDILDLLSQDAKVIIFSLDFSLKHLDLPEKLRDPLLFADDDLLLLLAGNL
jgi:hypothetical protein